MVSAVAICVTLALFLWLSGPKLRQGLATTDDAFFAVVARSIAEGRGYATPQSSQQSITFDSEITTGPLLILPVALLVRVFGTVDWLPGAATLLIVIGQLVVAAAVLSRRFGWPESLSFSAIMMLLIMLASMHEWYFGLFFGETPAFGFLLVGLALLSTSTRRAGLAGAALCFSMAISTKMISLFPVVGMVAAWLLMQVRARKAPALIASRAAVIGGLTLSVPLLFELVKAASLGPVGYLHHLRSTVVGIDTMGVEIRSWSSGARLSAFWSSLELFVPSWGFVAAVLVGSACAGLLIVRRPRTERGIAALGFAAMAVCGAIVHMAYIVLMSDVWRPRYFWPGVAIACCAVAAPVLALRARARATALIAVGISVAVFGLYRELADTRYDAAVAAIDMEVERDAVLKVLEDRRALPVAGTEWVAIADVLFFLNWDRTWAAGPDINRFRSETFIALLAIEFIDPGDPFFRTVTSTCDELTPGWFVRGAYLCGEPFWTRYN